MYLLNVILWLAQGFYMKAAVVALSSFEEVLLLDSDQVPTQDVTLLFKSREFHATGALLWPDFWHASWALDAAKIIDIRRKHMPTLSFESGQMLLNKTRCELQCFCNIGPLNTTEKNEKAVFELVVVSNVQQKIRKNDIVSI